MAAAANSPGGSPDEYKSHIENYFASKLIPGAPSTRYCDFFFFTKKKLLDEPILYFFSLTESLQRAWGPNCWLLMNKCDTSVSPTIRNA